MMNAYTILVQLYNLGELDDTNRSILASTLDAQMLKTTIKLKIAVTRKTY